MALKTPIFSAQPEGSMFVVTRDDKAFETPLCFPLAVPTRALAEAIVEEFGSQGEKKNLRRMPLAQMAFAAIDVTRLHREEIAGGIMRYGETELICQRADMPPDLVAEQEKVWRPYIDWCGEKFGAALRASSGVVPFEQNRPALASLRAFIETLDVFFLTGLSAACGALGSLVLGLALLEGRADATAVFEAAELEALWQIRKWGEDPASQSRHVDIKRDIETCAQWVALLRK